VPGSTFRRGDAEAIKRSVDIAGAERRFAEIEVRSGVAGIRRKRATGYGERPPGAAPP
jgi:hypothetical protein